MWFDELMDNCKQGVKSANENKTVFVPIFINLGVNILMALLLVGIGVLFFIAYGTKIESIFNGSGNIFEVVIPAVSIVVILALIYIGLKSAIEVGSINMYKSAIEGIKPGSKHFWAGIKSCFFRVFGIKVLYYILILVFSIPILALALLYSTTIGILTAGWGITFALVFIGVFFVVWSTAIVVDDLGAFKAIGSSIKLGAKYFWGLFILIFAHIMISKYVIGAFGGLIALVAGWFLNAVIATYFGMILVLIYKHKSKELL